MKPRFYRFNSITFSRAHSIFAGAVAVLLAGQSARATDLYWDINGTTANTGTTATGTWNTTNVFWNSDPLGEAAGTTTATTAAADVLHFSSGSGLTGIFTVSVLAASTQLADSLLFEEGTVTLGSTGTIGFGAGTSGIDVATGRNATISAFMTGTNGLTKTGPGILILGNTANSALTGNINVKDGALASGSNATNATNGQLVSLGDTNVLSTADATFSVNRNQNYNSPITVNAGSTGVKRISGGPGLTAQQTPSITTAITLNADVTLGNGTSGIYTGIGNAGIGSLALTGVITGSSARKITVEGTNPFTDAQTYIANITNATLAVGMVKIAGDNSLTFFGNVDVPRGVLALTGNANSLANSTISVGINAGLDPQNSSTIGGLSVLSGSGGTVTTSNNSARTLTIKGAGPYSFSGLVAAPAAGNPTVLNLVVGNGTNATVQTLSGSNSYTGTTTIGNQGKLIMGNVRALGANGYGRVSGTGGTSVSAGGTLDLNGLTGISEIITLNGTGVGASGALINGNATAASIAGEVVSSLSYGGGASGLDATSTVVFSDGGGSGAAAVTSLGLTSASFGITSNTTTYSVAPTVTITGGGGAGATATAVLTDGLVTGVTITNIGNGYITAPTIAFSAGTILVAGVAPTGTGNATNFTLAGIRLTSNGSGYTSAPIVSLSTGDASITANMPSVTLASNTTVGGIGDITIYPLVAGSVGLTKTGVNTVILAGGGNYTGSTTVEGGTLGIPSASLDDSSTVSIATGAVLHLTHGDIDDVAALKFNGVRQAAGVVYHVGNSGGFITGSGSIRVVSPYSTWASTYVGGESPGEDFDDDGTTNGIEYFMNTTSGFTANPTPVGGTVTWINGGNIPSGDYGAGNQFVVQISTDLVNWTNVPAGSVTNNSGSVSYTPTGPGASFARLLVNPN